MLVGMPDTVSVFPAAGGYRRGADDHHRTNPCRRYGAASCGTFTPQGRPVGDDANVGKFTNMIRQFSENSQFIIVTHNKMTMSTVDVIYGVTMQEPGVSKLVGVDFRSLATQD